LGYLSTDEGTTLSIISIQIEIKQKQNNNILDIFSHKLSFFYFQLSVADLMVFVVLETLESVVPSSVDKYPKVRDHSIKIGVNSNIARHVANVTCGRYVVFSVYSGFLHQ
jgi:hypothetical protein